MLKLLVTLLAFLALALAVLGLRQHRLELTAQTARLLEQIERRTHSTWDQEARITTVSNPLVLAQNLKSRGMAGDIGVRDVPRANRETDNPGDLIAPLRRRN